MSKKSIFVVLAGDPPVVGERCLDGGRCHHGCVPLSGSGLTDEWEAPAQCKCQICNGLRGGVPGNENIVDGIILCDYCHGDRLLFDRLRFLVGENCKVPPEGWICTRPDGQDGPCAAWPDPQEYPSKD